MNYEKKYKDALERASKLRVQNPFDTVSQMMEHVFPELAESKDERIRKKLIDTFKFYDPAMNSPFLLGILRKDILAWLEKQGEHKPWNKEDEDAIGMAIIALEDMYDEDEQNTTYCGYNLPFNKAAERLKSLKDRVQPKQEWSEEDEKMCQETIDWFERKCFPFALENENQARKSITWLKSLKEKINL